MAAFLPVSTFVWLSKNYDPAAAGNQKLTRDELLISSTPGGGGKRIRTADPLLAKQVLFQLSYTPVFTGRSHAPRCGAWWA